MQKNYNLYQDPFLIGQIYDNSISQIDSYVAQAAISFGQPVMIGNLNAQVPASVINAAEQPLVSMIESVIPYTASANGICLGIALRSDITPVGSVLAADNTTDYTTLITRTDGIYNIGAPVRVASLGRVVVLISDVIGTGTYSVYYQASTQEFYAVGSVIDLINDPVPVDAFGLTNLSFLSTPAANQLTVIQI